VGLDRARVVSNLQRLVPVTCKCGCDARVSHCDASDSGRVWSLLQAMRSGAAALALEAEPSRLSPAHQLSCWHISSRTPCHRAFKQENDGLSFPPLLFLAHHKSEPHVKQSILSRSLVRTSALVPSLFSSVQRTEIAGLVVGVVALAGLFNRAAECFKFVQLGRTFGKSFQTSQLKLDNARLRLSRWGKSLSLDDDVRDTVTLQGRFESEAIVKHTEALLGQTIELLKAYRTNTGAKPRLRTAALQYTTCKQT
jgi:hypothetical protein